eukprot:CAMPEP_0172482222 /NCGR_PEP_ID=MMETSP1066-20121228/8483_1 /TAXON_ID=671091 /ORGANISM="Coscinodiscus wailesii, Strain CCMP2513" /LENGTH=237 /DNA_ID=CAMNT_0013245171 /DNA_START=106 /DNA_END=819 /DNA_ORIENTATION=+
MATTFDVSALERIQLFSENLVSAGGCELGSLWKDEYDSNIAMVDHHHKMLFGLIQRIGDGNVSEKVLNNILQEMRAYTEYHFTHEEALFKKWTIPDHMHAHEGFVAKLVAIEKRAASGEPNVGLEARTILTNWFVNHILKTDMKGCKGILEKMTSAERAREAERCATPLTLSDLLRQCFEVIDSDMSGKIDVYEMGRIFKMLGVKASHEEIGAFVAKFDLNNDGEIDLLEFEKMIAQ